MVFDKYCYLGLFLLFISHRWITVRQYYLFTHMSSKKFSTHYDALQLLSALSVSFTKHATLHGYCTDVHILLLPWFPARRNSTRGWRTLRLCDLRWRQRESWQRRHRKYWHWPLLDLPAKQTESELSSGRNYSLKCEMAWCLMSVSMGSMVNLLKETKWMLSSGR